MPSSQPSKHFSQCHTWSITHGVSTVSDWWWICTIINYLCSTEGPETSSGGSAVSETDHAAASHSAGTVTDLFNRKQKWWTVENTYLTRSVQAWRRRGRGHHRVRLKGQTITGHFYRASVRREKRKRSVFVPKYVPTNKLVYRWHQCVRVCYSSPWIGDGQIPDLANRQEDVPRCKDGLHAPERSIKARGRDGEGDREEDEK